MVRSKFQNQKPFRVKWSLAAAEELRLIGVEQGIKEERLRTKKEITELNQILLDVLWQACGNEKDKVIDTSCLSAMETACQYLHKKGLLNTINGRIYKEPEKEALK